MSKLFVAIRLLTYIHDDIKHQWTTFHRGETCREYNKYEKSNYPQIRNILHLKGQKSVCLLIYGPAWKFWKPYTNYIVRPSVHPFVRKHFGCDKITKIDLFSQLSNFVQKILHNKRKKCIMFEIISFCPSVCMSTSLFPTISI